MGVSTLVYWSGLSPQRWCWCGFGLLAECGLMRGGLELKLDSCSALMSQVRGCGPQTATALCGCLMTPAVPAEMAPLRQSSFAPCGEISKQHLFVTPGSPLDQHSADFGGLRLEALEATATLTRSILGDFILEGFKTSLVELP
ncbi:uncharacterized [Tachysurus ichikawai]